MAAQLQPDSSVLGAKRPRSLDQSPALSASSESLDTEDDARLPLFLRLTPENIEAKFEDISQQQAQRIDSGKKAATADHPWTFSFQKEHRILNRYSDIWPWEAKRIKLKVPSGNPNYINASPIALHSTTDGSERRYIATQGPKQNNVDHFWQMIWQETESPSVIVMLTQLTESMREKCYQYFPEHADSKAMPLKFVDESNQPHKGSVKVSSIETDNECRTTVRKITLTYNGKEKLIWHLFFQAWPDFGIPQDADRNALLSLIRLSREKNAGWNNPRVVHCSAGVGRSGTFIALEHLIDELEQGHFDQLGTSDEDPIFNTVNHLREQRMTMVQSETQYQFLYDSLLDAFKQRLRAKDGISTPIPHHSSSERLLHGEPSPKAARLSRGLYSLLTSFRSRSSPASQKLELRTSSDDAAVTTALLSGESSVPASPSSKEIPASTWRAFLLRYKITMLSLMVVFLGAMWTWYLLQRGQTRRRTGELV